ncbi:hypothetical protein Tco_0721510 [Tanacetum coccineum]
MRKRPRSTRGQSSASQEVSAEERVQRLRIFENGVHQMRYETLARYPVHSGDVIDWEFLANQGLEHSFLNSINTDPFSGPQWMNLFRINEPVYRELVWEFFSSFEFDAPPCRVGLYTKQQSRDRATLSGLSRAETVKENLMLLKFWPNIGDESFNVGNTKGQELDLWRDVCTRIARSFRVLTGEMTGALSVEPPPHVFKKKSLIAMGVIMELHNGGCCCTIKREAEDEDEADDEVGDEGGWRLRRHVPEHEPRRLAGSPSTIDGPAR